MAANPALSVAVRRSMNDTPLLLISSGEGDADFYYASGFSCEIALYLEFAQGDDLLLTYTTEVERAVRLSRAKMVSDRLEFGWTEGHDQFASWAKVAATALKSRGATSVRVAQALPVGYTHALNALGVDTPIDYELFFARRRHKGEDEVAAIRAAQAAGEAACESVISELAAAEVSNGTLWRGAQQLTSEYLAIQASATALDLDHRFNEIVIAGSPGCAMTHFSGHGPLRADAPIVIDLFPYGRSSRYFGDTTRTVVAGSPSKEFIAAHAAVFAAHQRGISMIRAGVNARDVHHAICEAFVEAGFGTNTEEFGGNREGPQFIHGTGHGIGLAIHEDPYLRDMDWTLEEGDVVTIEPGLYLKGWGGVRIEDAGLVTTTGFNNFNRLPYGHSPVEYTS